MKKKTGRPRRYNEETESCALHLPTRFWTFLSMGEGSRTEAFIEAMASDKGVKTMRRILKGKKK